MHEAEGGEKGWERQRHKVMVTGEEAPMSKWRYGNLTWTSLDHSWKKLRRGQDAWEVMSHVAVAGSNDTSQA
jgi:hypothetical protein